MEEIRNEPILLAHHPLCGKFDDHLLNVNDRKLCRGCFTVYPATVVFMVALLLLRPSFIEAFVLALVLFAAQLFRFFPALHWMVIGFNLLLGCSLAAIIYAAIICPPDLRIYFYPFIAAVIVSFELIKGRKVLARCHSCPSYGSFPQCAKGPSAIEKENNE